jgi:hypothetical protein
MIAEVACFLAFTCALEGKVYIVSGDTIAMYGQTIHLYGIEAPSTSTSKGRDARDYLERLTKNKVIVCWRWPTRKNAKSTDYKKGLIVAKCWLRHAPTLSQHLSGIGYANPVNTTSSGPPPHTHEGTTLTVTACEGGDHG